jgi:flagellar FliL protein
MAEEKTEETKKKKGKMGIIIPVVVLVLGLGGGGFFFLSAGKSGNAATAETTTTLEPHGPIVRLEPITLNLSDGHILKVGLALQLAAEPVDEHLAAYVAAQGGGHGAVKVDTASPLGGLEAKALDIAIAHLGNLTYDELSKPNGRTHAKEELAKEIAHTYHEDIHDVYFTNFVMS